MAIQKRTDQQLYTGKGPLDSKATIKTYAELTDVQTWTKDDNFVAYNGMLTAVWLNKDDTSKNGLYLLFDPDVTTALKKPDVVNSNNWHRIAELSDVEAFATQLQLMQDEITGIKTQIATLEEDKVIVTRDNEYNYKQKTPKNNEICLVDVPGYGIRVKIGDGTTPFIDLKYLDDGVLSTIDNLIVKGYFYQGNFYRDTTYEIIIPAIVGRICIDAVTSKLYVYNGVSYESTTVNATADIAGVVKLYDKIGYNEDGAMTQRAVTDELNQKFEVDFDKIQEMLIFDNDFDDNV